MAFDEESRPVAGGEQAPSPELVRQLLGTVMQDTIRAEFERFLGAAPYERTPSRRGHRNGRASRSMISR